MKTNKYILFCLFLLYLAPAKAINIPKDENKYVTISGTVKDKSDKRVLSYANVSIAGSTESTVTNADGEFTFKVKEPEGNTTLEVSHLGYANARIRLKEGDSDLSTVWLTPSTLMLNEVVVSGRNPRELVEEAIRKIPANYSTVADRLTGFYRETSRKRRRYINIAEAVIDLHKTPYTQDAGHDRVRILKGRRLLSPKASDTLAVKLLGGPNASIYLDVVKNPDLLLSPEVLPCYDFHFEEPTAIDQRPQYVVSFTPSRKLPYALYYGKFYIDKERLSFTRAEFFLDTSDRYKATQVILHSKPFGLRFKPVEVAYQVNYTDHDGKTYLSYVRNELRFKCDWRRRLFSTSYAVVSEMVVTDIKPSTTDIPIREAFGKDQILSMMPRCSSTRAFGEITTSSSRRNRWRRRWVSCERYKRNKVSIK